MGARAEKTQFFGLFLKNCLRRRKFGQIRVFIVVQESSENQFDRPKKKADKKDQQKRSTRKGRQTKFFGFKCLTALFI